MNMLWRLVERNSLSDGSGFGTSGTTSSPERARSGHGIGALFDVLRRALYARLSYTHRHPQVHKEDFHRKFTGVRTDHTGVEFAWSYVRARVSGSGIVRRGLRVGLGAQTNRDRKAAAARDGLRVW